SAGQGLVVDARVLALLASGAVPGRGGRGRGDGGAGAACGHRLRGPPRPVHCRTDSIAGFPDHEATVTRHSLVHRLGRFVLAVLILLAAGWGALALWFQLPGATPVRLLAILAWCLLGVGAVAASVRRRLPLALPVFVLALVALAAWWGTLAPSHERVWADDVARLLHAEVQDERVVLHNVRNFEWRTPEDYTPRWETRGYDLDRLVSADLVLSYWMGPAIAHTLVSFGFRSEEHTSELQSRENLVCRLLLEKKKPAT